MRYKATFSSTHKKPSLSFDSLQTGTRIASTLISANYFMVEGIMFQFPSNGKAHRKPACLFTLWIRIRQSFDSLQTGTRIASCGKTPTVEVKNAFPFPSNGKPEHKFLGHAGGKIFSVEVFPFPSNGNAHRKWRYHCG